MSINNTNVDQIKTQVTELILDCINTTLDVKFLETKYVYLYTVSKTLFEFIIRETKSKNFNKSRFDNNLDFMLNYILKIQNNELTQNDASESVGELVAKQYIPQLK